MTGIVKDSAHRRTFDPIKMGEYYFIQDDPRTWWCHGMGEGLYLIATDASAQLLVNGDRLLVCGGDDQATPLHDSGWTVGDLQPDSPDKAAQEAGRKQRMAAVWDELLVDVNLGEWYGFIV